MSGPTHVCQCAVVSIGSYDAAIELVAPDHLRRSDARGICVDACLALEVSQLWRAGIRTTGACCGHNQAPAFIGVAFADIPRMKAAGYSPVINPCRPEDQDSFAPRSLELRR